MGAGHETVNGLEPRPAEEQYLNGWNEGDCERLNLTDRGEGKKLANARATIKLLPWFRINEESQKPERSVFS